MRFYKNLDVSDILGDTSAQYSTVITNTITLYVGILMALLIIMLNALLGLSFTIGKAMLSHATPCFIVALRMLLGGSVLTAYHILCHRSLRLPSRRDWLLCMQYAALGIVLFPILRAWGLQHVPSAKAALFFALFPLSTAATAFILRGERITTEQICGLLLGCCAMIPLLSNNSAAKTPYSTMHLPELALIISVLALSSGIVTLQHLVKDRNCPPLLITGMSMLSGGLCALLCAYLNEPIWLHGELVRFGGLMVAQTLISNVICSILQTHLLTQYSATTMSLASFLTPVSSIAYGIVLLNEPCGWNIIGALILLAISMILYHLKSLKHHIKIQRTADRTDATQSAQSSPSNIQ